ncbi:EamA/RhaT family transporter [Halarcobacter bivalviorum]|nr:DMT family transporter [Halarcobacter bivalviorum]AXH13403.1 EamA/RhaT family transporter [Halarcobacter bivalviorum]
MLIAVLVIPFSDAIGKWLSTTYSPMQITFFRFFLQAILIYFIAKILRKKIASFKWIYFFLAVFISSCMFLLFWGLMYLPLANNIALFFIEPLILTLLSIIFLKEKVSKELVFVLIIGFIGTLVIIRPNWSAYGTAAILPILAAVFYALYLMAIRVSKDIKDIVSMQFWIGFLASIFIGIIYLVLKPFEIEVIAFQPFEISTWWLLLSLTVITVVTQFLISKALYYANASLLASFQYLEIISATLLGWLIFSDIPDSITMLGAVIVIFSGVYLIKVERSIKS